jgi:uncharacterized protein (TIGR02594 family)
MAITRTLTNVPTSEKQEVIDDFKSEGASVEVTDLGNGLWTITGTFPDLANRVAAAAVVSSSDRAAVASNIAFEHPAMRRFAESLSVAAERAGVDRVLLGAISWVESRFQNVQNTAESSATGPFQFLPTTWKKLVDEHGGATGIANDMIGQPRAQAIMAAILLHQNREQLSAAINRAPKDVELYLAHFFGPAAAAAVLQATSTERIDKPLRRFYSDTPVGVGHVETILRDNASILKTAGGRARKISTVISTFKRRLNEGKTKADHLFRASELDEGAVAESDPPWLNVAFKEVGVKEIDGSGSNPDIEKYHASTTMGSRPDDVPWCASFVSFCMENSNSDAVRQANVRSARARDWMNWGNSLDAAERGCVVVLKRGRDSIKGHVGFFLKDTEEDKIALLGGNQSNQVKISTYKKSDILALRWLEV